MPPARGPGSRYPLRMPKPFLAKPGPWLVAHRGGSGLAPENTLPAFDVAVRLGADCIETDVRRTRDGAVVIFHDDDTFRLTGEAGTIEARSLAEVRALDAGSSFTPDGGATFPWRGRGVIVPTLAEALARAPSMRFTIDAKGEEEALAEALVAVVRAAGAVERVALGSFHDAQGERLRALLPEAAHFLSQGPATQHVMAARSGAAPATAPAGWDLADLPHRLGDMLVVDEALVRHFHALGMPVHVWTVDEEADMRALLAIGSDGLVTDRPDLLARVLGRG
jgi:glycerophosphoryl diester phosphodiesterase